MEDVSDMMDEDIFLMHVSWIVGEVELIVEIENRFDIRVPVTEFGRDDWNTQLIILALVLWSQNALKRLGMIFGRLDRWFVGFSAHFLLSY